MPSGLRGRGAGRAASCQMDLPSLCVLFSLFTGILCQSVVEQPLTCYQSNDCSGIEGSLPYSECCAAGSESFVMNGSCYICAELLSFSVPFYTIDEGADVVSVAVQRQVNPGTNLLFFSIIVSDKSAVAGADYAELLESRIGLNNNILENESYVETAIIILDDDIVECNETFTVILIPLSKDFSPIGTITASTTVTIIDNDYVDIGVSPTSMTVQESFSVISFSLNKTGVTSNCVRVVVEISGNELIYERQEDKIMNVTFGQNDQMKMFFIVVQDDDIVEETENHYIHLRVPTGETRVTLLQENVTVTVSDDDKVTLTLETDEVRVAENSRSVKVEIRKEGDCERPVSVRVYTESGSAKGDVDFTPVNMTVELLPADDSYLVEVNITEDETTEDEESFMVKLEVPLHESAVVLDLNSTTIIIIEDTFNSTPSCAKNQTGCGSTPRAPSTTTVSVIVGSSLISILVISVVLVLIVFYRCKSKKKRRQDLREDNNDRGDSSESRNNYVLDTCTPRRLSLEQQLTKELSEKNMLLSKQQLHSSDIVGQGETGVVYKGYLDTQMGRELVAIKTGKALFSKSDNETLMKEVTTMLYLKHPNVMSLIGVCLDGDEPLLIMPFMSNGTVLEYVRHHRKELLLSSEEDQEKVKSTRISLLGICHQVAKGMHYLAQEKFVHRDLAARNCMIDQRGVIKVSDFGLTEDMYGTNYFRRRPNQDGSEEKVPIRWMAPESIENNLYNESTDVWAFGVTVWEVFTCGRVPYLGIRAMSILNMLHSGERLDRPASAACQDELYHMMVSCWDIDSARRPTFSLLYNELCHLLEVDAGYLELSPLKWIKNTDHTTEETSIL